jgi:hypothetical protein
MANETSNMVDFLEFMVLRTRKATKPVLFKLRKKFEHGGVGTNYSITQNI